MSPSRVTPDLLTLRGRSTAKRLRRLSKSTAWGPKVRAAAARLLRAWRGVVNIDDKNKQENGNVQGEAAATPNGGRDGPPGQGRTPAQSSPNGMPPPRPSLVPRPLWERLAKEFNPSQLWAVWAAAASAKETSQERLRERAGAETAARETAGTDSSGEGKGKRSTEQRPGHAAGSADGAATKAVAVSREGTEGGVVLLQGPPGTGKTRTVLGVVSAILARQKEKLGSGAAGGGGGAGSSAGVAGRGMGMTLQVGARQKRPGVAGQWAAAKTHQRVSEERVDTAALKAGLALIFVFPSFSEH